MTAARRWIGPLLIALAVATMVSVTFLRWCDPIVDFGRELYVPWRITQGDVLYRDIAYFTGPLSPYVNALWFSLFGVGLHTLIIANLCVLAVMLGLTYQLVRLAADRITATLACLSIVGIFAFGQYTNTGNFNWVCPYSHELTHGITLSLASLYLLVRFARNRRWVWVLASGALFGAVFLTKAEVALAAAGAMLVALLLLRVGWRAFAAWCAAAFVMVMLAACLLAMALPWPAALKGAIGSWAYIFNPVNTVGSPFNQYGMGLDHPGSNLMMAVDWTLRYALALEAGVVLALMAKRERFKRGAILMASLIPLVLLRWWPDLGLADIGRALPVYVLVFAVIVAIRPGRQAILAAVIVFALLMLAKMPLNTRMFHYGFTLALPAAVVVVILFAHWLPRRIARAGGDGRVLLASFIVLWGVVVSAHVRITMNNMRNRTFAVGAGADRFYAISRGEFIEKTAEFIRARTQPDDTLAVFPEGVMLNYLTRRRTPTRYINFIPHEVHMYGEQHIVDALRAHPPDCVVMVDRDTSEYGYQYFGRDYAHGIVDFLRPHYPNRRQLGAAPFTGEGFGVQVWLPAQQPQ